MMFNRIDRSGRSGCSSGHRGARVAVTGIFLIVIAAVNVAATAVIAATLKAGWGGDVWPLSVAVTVCLDAIGYETWSRRDEVGRRIARCRYRASQSWWPIILAVIAMATMTVIAVFGI